MQTRSPRSSEDDIVRQQQRQEMSAMHELLAQQRQKEVQMMEQIQKQQQQITELKLRRGEEAYEAKQKGKGK